MTFNHLLFSLMGGILPALLWLWFWLKEDRVHPEPRRLIILTFFAGMAAVVLAMPLEGFAYKILEQTNTLEIWGGILLLLLWALIEEWTKYFAAKKAALNKKDYDEPVDALIYLITAALGFAAAENVIFLAEVSIGFGFLPGFFTANLRFLGATLIHILSSAAIGASLAFSFFHKEKRHRNLIFGFIFATILHMLFNFFIIKSNRENIFFVFAPFWSLIIILLLIFEKVKRIKLKKKQS